MEAMSNLGQRDCRGETDLQDQRKSVIMKEVGTILNLDSGFKSVCS